MLTAAHKARIIEGDATAEKSPSAKKRGRPPGSKNKPKEAAVPEPATATDAPAAPTTTALGNGVDPADSAKERAAYYDDDLGTRMIRCIDWRLIRRCSHDCRTLYGRTARRAPYLVARYDCYSFAPAIFLVVKELETEISWLEHRLWRRQQRRDE